MMLVASRVLDPAVAPADRIALRDATQTLTYQQLRDLMNRVGAQSRTWRVHSPGQPPDLALLGPSTPEMVACLLGLAMAGWAVGVLDPQWTDDELRSALAQLSPRVVVAERSQQQRLVGLGWVAADHVPGRLRDWRLHLREPGATGSPMATDATPDATFYIGFTSGSSGLPKAFARSHRSWCMSFAGLDRCVPLDPGTILIPGALSGSHFLFGALHGLHIGGTVELSAPAASRVAARLDGDQPVRAIYVVPSILAQVAALVHPDAPALPTTIFCAGAHLEQSVRDLVARQMPSSGIVEYYGASELSFVAIQTPDDATPAGAVGTAFPGVEISIRDELGAPLPAGATGRIFVRSPLVFSGYRGRVPPTAAQRLEGDWWSVGDHGALDERGNLSVAGRGTSLIITGATNVQPEEIEGVLTSTPGVIDCAVVGMPHPRWGQEVVAVLVVDSRYTLTRSDVRARIAHQLTRAKRPRRYIVLEGPLPTGRTGKLDRLAVRARVSDGDGHELR